MVYLAFALLVSTVGILVVVIRNRPKTSTDSSIREFEKGLDALAPRPGVPKGARPRSED
jgi:hypothetical protein